MSPGSFTAIDIETANADFSSICQIGLVRFDAGSVVEEWQSLVNPEDDFDWINVSIHGITEAAVASAPTWLQLFGDVTTKLRGQIAVCHTAFDRVSLARACVRHNLLLPDVTWLDSARVARRAWPEFCGSRGYSLKRVAAMLSLTFVAHVAVEDARVAGTIVLRAIAETGLPLEAWLTRVQHPIFADTIAQAGNVEGPLAGNVLVFTGAIAMVRSQAALLAASAGCDVREGVTRDTTLLVVGDQDIRMLAGQEKSNKHRKAERLIAGGQAIRIIAEQDFLNLLAGEDQG